MAKGRKPKSETVVPLKGDSYDGNIAHAKAQADQKAKELKPVDLPEKAAAEWDSIAPVLAAPHLDRLKPHYVPAIVEMCHLLARIKEIREQYKDLESETYAVVGRNGTQKKMHPHIAQLNDAQRQLRSYFASFGMTPADERNLAPGQGNLFDVSDEFFR